MVQEGATAVPRRHRPRSTPFHAASETSYACGVAGNLGSGLVSRRRIGATWLASFLLLACGGSSVRYLENDATGGSGAASGGSLASGGSVASGGSAGSGTGHPLDCVALALALERAKACMVDADCGKLVDAWPCDRPDAVPPMVGIYADLEELEHLLVDAPLVECSLPYDVCTTCYVEEPQCVEQKCAWRWVNCGPPLP